MPITPFSRIGWGMQRVCKYCQGIHIHNVGNDLSGDPSSHGPASDNQSAIDRQGNSNHFSPGFFKKSWWVWATSCLLHVGELKSNGGNPGLTQVLRQVITKRILQVWGPPLSPRKDTSKSCGALKPKNPQVTIWTI